MTPPDEFWRVDFSVAFKQDQKLYHGCECFLTRQEAETRRSQMRTSDMKYEITLSHYRRTAEV